MSMNFYSMGMGPMAGGNVYESLKTQYGCGHADFGTAPKAFEYPMDVLVKRPEPAIERSRIFRFIQKLFIV